MTVQTPQPAQRRDAVAAGKVPCHITLVMEAGGQRCVNQCESIKDQSAQLIQSALGHEPIEAGAVKHPEVTREAPPGQSVSGVPATDRLRDAHRT